MRMACDGLLTNCIGGESNLAPNGPETLILGLEIGHNLTQISENELHDTIINLYSQIRMVKTYINTRIPVGCLLPDILAKVFQIIVDDWGAIDERDSRRYSPYGWLALTHVCSHWRNTAIETSTLWTRIVLHKYKIANLVLERSRDAPLFVLCWHDLFTEIEQKQQHWIVNCLSPHLPRVEKVQIAFTSRPVIFPPLPNPLFARQVPLRVRLIRVKMLFPFSSIDSMAKAKASSLGKHKQFGPSLPPSQIINADPIKTMVGGDLRHLSMIGVARLKHKAFLSILDKTPQLESLQVLCVGSLDLPFNLISPLITLPRLRSLTLDLGTLRILSIFLQHLSYPPTTIVHLACVVLPFDALSEADTGTHLRNIISTGPSTLNVTVDSEDLTIKTTNFTLIVISPRRRQSLLIKYLFSSVVTDSLEHLTFGPGIDSFRHKQWELAGTYEAIQARVGSLEALSISSIHHLTHLVLPRVTHKITTAVKVTSSVHHLTHHVIPHVTRKVKHTAVAGAMPFPKLSRLFIGRMNHGDIKTLYDVLESRKKQGNMIKTIHIPTV